MRKRILWGICVLFLCGAALTSRAASYEELWKQVKQYERKDLPKSAYEVVERIAEKAGKDDPSGRENGQRSRGAFRGLGMAVFPFQTWNAAGTYVRELWSRTPNFCVIHEHQYVKQFVPSARSFMRAGVARAGRGRHGGYRSAVCSREEIRTVARQPAAGEGGRVSPTLLWQSIFRLKRFAFQTIRSVASR